MKIVCIDDDKAIREMLRVFLVQKGFTVLTAGNGSDGIELIETQAPDMVLLDWTLPDISGLEICTYLRKSSSIPVIMLTGRAGESERIMALEAGVDDYLVKPFSLIELFARMRSLLRRSAGMARPIVQ